MTGQRTGYSTYGEYGDVLLYSPNGQSGTPIIHRAILFMQWDPGGWYNVTDLTGLPCGVPGAVYATPGTPATAQTAKNCGVTHLTGELDLFRVGWDALNISLTLNAPALGSHSGFVTLGDNNTLPDQAGGVVPAISELVEPGWIIGVARGMIPWFGAVKLLLDGNANRVPAQSWQYLGLTIVGVILVAFAIHYALRREGVETPLRRREEEDERATIEENPPPESLAHRFWERVRGRSEDEDEGEEAAAEEKRHRRTRPPPSHSSVRRGRPAPRVRRNGRPAKKHEPDDEL